MPSAKSNKSTVYVHLRQNSPQRASSQGDVVDLTFDSSEEDESSNFQNDGSMSKPSVASAQKGNVTSPKKINVKIIERRKPQSSTNDSYCHENELSSEERASLRRFFSPKGVKESRVQQPIGANEVHTNDPSPQERAALKRYFQSGFETEQSNRSQIAPVEKVVVQKGEGSLKDSIHAKRQEVIHECDQKQNTSDKGPDLRSASESPEFSGTPEVGGHEKRCSKSLQSNRENVNDSVHSNKNSLEANLGTQKTGSAQGDNGKKRKASDVSSVGSKDDPVKRKKTEKEVIHETTQRRFRLEKGNDKNLNSKTNAITPDINCIDLLDSSDSDGDDQQLEIGRKPLTRKCTQQEFKKSSTSPHAATNNPQMKNGGKNVNSFSNHVSQARKEVPASKSIPNMTKDRREVKYIQLSDSESNGDESEDELEIIGVFNPVKLSLEQKLAKASHHRQKKLMDSLKAGSSKGRIQKMKERQREALQNFERKEKAKEEQKQHQQRQQSLKRRQERKRQRSFTDHDRAEFPPMADPYSSPSRRFTMFSTGESSPFSQYPSNTNPHEMNGHHYNRKTDFRFFDNNENLREEQERLFRESAGRARAQEQAKRQHLTRTEGIQFFTQPLGNLRELPSNHWKWSCPYSRLGLPPQCSYSLVKTHYRRLCLLYHPDKAKLKDAPDRFQGVKEAYETITTTVRRS
jgi:hypothetical protein